MKSDPETEEAELFKSFIIRNDHETYKLKGGNVSREIWEIQETKATEESRKV